jgi:hypothetical protein
MCWRCTALSKVLDVVRAALIGSVAGVIFDAENGGGRVRSRKRKSALHLWEGNGPSIVCHFSFFASSA